MSNQPAHRVCTHGTWVWRAVALVAAAVFLVALAGCGGGDKEKDKAPSTEGSIYAASSGGSSAPPTSGGGGSSPPAGDPMGGGAGGQAGPPGGGGGYPGVGGGAIPGGGIPGEEGLAGSGGAPEVKLPENVADWTPDDFRTARKANHQDLARAVTDRAAKTKDDSKYAELWRELLAIKPQGGAAGFGGYGVPPGGFGDAQPGFPGAGGPGDLGAPSGAPPPTGAGAGGKPIHRHGEQLPPGAGGAQGGAPPPAGAGAAGGGGRPPGGTPGGPGGPGGGAGGVGAPGVGAPGVGPPGAGGGAGGALAPPVGGPGGQGDFGGYSAPGALGYDGEGGSGGGVVKTLIDALGANTTDVARQALVDVIKGKIATEVDDATQTSYALAALMSNMNPQREATALELLTKPESFRQAGAKVTPAALRQQALAALEGGTFPSLKKKLAATIPTLPAAGQKPLVDLFLKVRADNIEAQVALFTSPRIDEGAKRSLLTPLASVARQTYHVVLGMPPEGPSAAAASSSGPPGAGPGLGPPGVGGAAGPAPPPGAAGFGPMGQPGEGEGGTPDPGAGADKTILSKEDLLKAAPLIWSNAMVSEVEKRLATVRLTADSMRLLELGAAIPATATRAKFQRLLARPLTENPRKLTKLGLIDDVLRDPGLLLVVKTAPREDRPLKPPRTRTRNRDNYGQPGEPPGAGGPGAGPPGAGGPGGASDDENAVLEPKELKNRWMDTVDDAVAAVMAQMNLAAVTRGSGEDAQDVEEIVGSLSIRKQKEAAIDCAVALTLPDDLSEGADKCDQLNLKVRYAAFTQHGRPATVKTAYGSQVRGGKLHFTRGDYYWYEGVTRKGDSLVSVDLMVSVGKYRSAGARGTDDSGGFGGQGGFGGAAPGVPGPGGPGGLGGLGGPDGGQSQKTDTPAGLYIEVLEIEILNPSPPGVAAK